MAIKVGGTTVIDDSRNITNAADVAYDSSNGTVVTITTASPTMNLNSGDVFSITPSGTTSLAFSNTPSAGRAKFVVLEITNGGAVTVNWPTNTRWPGGSAPTLTAAGTDIVVFFTDDGGSNWRASRVQADSK